jgi:heavy metal sensor kinase
VLSRLPIRAKVTLVFAVVMAVVLATTSLVVFVEFRSDLDHAFKDSLRARAGDIAALVHQAGAGSDSSRRSPLIEDGDNLAQIIDARDGKVLDSPPHLRGASLLPGERLRRARSKTVFFERHDPRKPATRLRVFALPVRAAGRPIVIAVAQTTEDRDDALTDLAALLALGSGAALLLASMVGYGVAAAVLRPVERMRLQAERISASSPGMRLPVSEADDEVGRLGSTLNAMLARLESAFARERTFVADASHELRTPLAVLKTELELALRSNRPKHELEAALRSASEETDRLAQLAEDLLVIARSDQSGLQISRSPTEAGDLFDVIAERFSRRVADHHRELRIRAPAGLTFEADPPRVEQALSNLVENALRHGAGAISLSATAEGAVVRLAVADEGEGFPPAFLAQAFERFSRADAARSRGGAGLGLAIVEAIALAHGGRAGARNRADGPEVWIELPAPLMVGRTCAS